MFNRTELLLISTQETRGPTDALFGPTNAR